MTHAGVAVVELDISFLNTAVSAQNLPGAECTVNQQKWGRVYGMKEKNGNKYLYLIGTIKVLKLLSLVYYPNINVSYPPSKDISWPWRQLTRQCPKNKIATETGTDSNNIHKHACWCPGGIAGVPETLWPEF